jgi:hypothetical protein
VTADEYEQELDAARQMAVEILEFADQNHATHKKLHEAGKWLIGSALCVGFLLGLCIACFVAPEHQQWNIFYVSVPAMITSLYAGRRADKIMESIDQ